MYLRWEFVQGIFMVVNLNVDVTREIFHAVTLNRNTSLLKADRSVAMTLCEQHNAFCFRELQS
jgi:hypothetical protein